MTKTETRWLYWASFWTVLALVANIVGAHGLALTCGINAVVGILGVMWERT